MGIEAAGYEPRTLESLAKSSTTRATNLSRSYLMLHHVSLGSLHLCLEEDDEDDDEEDHVGVDDVQVGAVVLRLLVAGVAGCHAALD